MAWALVTKVTGALSLYIQRRYFKMAEQPKKKGGKIIKKPLSERFAETFFGGTVKEAKAYTMREIIVPAIKNMVYDSFTGALDRLLNGGNATYHNRNSGIWTPGVTILGSSTQKTNYSTGTKLSTALPTTASSRNPSVIIFDNKAAADDVLNILRTSLMTYPTVTVEAYYDAANDYVSGASKLVSITDSYYGWTDLSTARVKPFQGGYIIQFPPTQAI